MKLKKDLSFFDLTNIIVGSIIGADIYIASALTAGMIGPLSMLVWVVAGAFATVLALVFAYSSYYVPRVGGPFAFVSEAFDDFYGFLTGWSMWIAEMMALPIFAIAFTQYLRYFVHLDAVSDIAVKAAFIFGLTFVNVVGVRMAGKVNDVLTILKLMPLILLVLAGVFFLAVHPDVFAGNYSNIAPLGFGGFGAALVLIFWAYVGFEMGTLPASEVRDAKRTIPKAIITGMAIVMAFYLSTNFIVYGVSGWMDLSHSTIPLVLVSTAILGTIGAVVMAVGALVSVSGSDEAGVLGTARLSYAMSIRGLFPRIFSRVHPKYKTPYMALLIQGVVAFALSIYSGISSLISFSVFNLGFSFLLTCLAFIILKKGSEKKLYGQNVLPWVGIAICLYLIYSTSVIDKLAGAAIILIGIPIYVFLSPKEDMRHLGRLFLSEEAIFSRRLERKERFLGNFMRLLHKLYRHFKDNYEHSIEQDD